MSKNSKTGSAGKKITNKVKVQGLGTITVPQTSGLLQVSPAVPTPGGNDNPESRSRRK
jgi:hypothetical protein